MNRDDAITALRALNSLRIQGSDGVYLRTDLGKRLLNSLPEIIAALDPAPMPSKMEVSK